MQNVQQYSDGQLKWIIDNGLRPSGMPGSSGILSGDEIWSIVADIVVWPTPLDKSAVPSPGPGRFTLVQKNLMFTPHLLAIPVGSVDAFLNNALFFHSVFSSFNGKRFDLGLYEAGSSREVQLSREGVSYTSVTSIPQSMERAPAMHTGKTAVPDCAE